jgi:hypothetical protein
MSNNAPHVDWNKPEVIPEVKKYGNKLFWVAVQSQFSGAELPKVSVYLANYINSPLDLDENGEPINPDHHVDDSGEPIGSVGWHNQYDHPEYNGFYQPICFGDQIKLLGWAEYIPPVF